MVSEEGGEDEEGGYNGEDGPCSRLGSSLFTRLSLDEMGAFFGIFNIVVEFAARVVGACTWCLSRGSTGSVSD
ncbi:unnamed protein product [Fusarium graminearum]|nr:unnamed protein product [Fusarium graminearum]